MTSTLHLPTMLLMTVASSITMAMAIFVVRGRGRGDGMGLWSGGLLLHAVAYVLLALRGQAHDLLTIVLANLLLSGSFSLALAAVHQFQGHPPPWWRLLVPLLATVVLFTLLLDNYRARLLVAGTVFPIQLGMAIWVLLRPLQPVPGRGALLVVAGLSMQALTLVVRGVLASAYWMPLGGILEASGAQFATFFSTFIVVVLSSLGFIFMTKDRADESNRQLAAYDPLTGVANRRTLIATLDRDVARAVRAREPISLMMVDIDHFKAVNDTHGHLAGDQVLRHVAHLLRARLRAQDLVGRYGGEEFLVLLPDTASEGAFGVAQQLRRNIAEAPCELGGRQISVTVSIGVFGGRPEPGDHWDLLIDAADRALYAAKENGRNRVVLETRLHAPAHEAARRSGPETDRPPLQ